jgi:hypothetical protein
MPCKPDVEKQTKNAERAEAFLVSVSGLNVSPKRLLENRFIKFSLSQLSFQTTILWIQIGQTPCFLAFHPAELITLTMTSRISDSKALQHYR